METTSVPTTLAEDCCVKVAVHIRPLIGDEKLQSCKDCVTVVHGKPQVQLGTHSFTFDHVYGSTGSPSSAMFEECVSPLVDGLFQGYNATVLAYGQILKEEVRDLLDDKSEITNGQTGKVNSPGKPPIQIRETSNGVITLAGSTECSVKTLKEMTDCLEHGSLSRATGSTNMNNQSSRSHAIFTITLEQMRKTNSNILGDNNANDCMSDEYLCAKLHLVDLAGSERAKRTGSNGMRFKEGVHINKGLLALGNVISALGDEKKRKEGAHVPYRDSKLTRLLQDSLGGNSRTVMIACVSPADINAEETLNTLKYANRARNIQNKPVVNRDPVSSEMLKMRQQLECLQAELCARGGGSSVELQVLRERISWLEATNQDLCRELHLYRNRGAAIDQSEKVAKVCNFNENFGTVCDSGVIEEEAEKEWEHTILQDSMGKELHELNKRLEQKESEMRHFEGSDTMTLKQHFGKKIMELEDEKRAVQIERDRLLTEVENLSASSDGQAQKVRDLHSHKLKSLESQIQELKKKQENQVQLLRQKQKSDEAAKRLQDEIQFIKAQKVQLQHKIKQEAEQFRQWKASREKELLQIERDRLLTEVENLSASSDGQAQKVRDLHSHKLKSLESQIQELKKKQENQVQLLRQKQKSDEAAKRLQDEIQFIKAQKVQLQHKIKQEAEQFRQWKASREKELLQVLQRKTEEAAMATKRLKELLEARKPTRDSSLTSNGHVANGQNNEKVLQRWLDHELAVMVNVHEVRYEYEKQSEVRAALAEELAVLRQVDEFASKGVSPPRGNNGFSRASSLSPNARMARISSLENMLSISSNSLVSMASQLSEAEERERAFATRGRWNQLRSMADSKNLLQYMFNSLAEARCQSWEKDIEIKEMEEQLKELVGLLRQSELRRKEIEKELKVKEQTVATALASSASGNSHNSLKHLADDMSGPLSPNSVPAPKQLKYTAGIANGLVTESASFLDQKRKMVPVGQLSLKKSPLTGQSPGKLWRWKRSHHQWLLQFKWKWQKPWRLSELIKHSDETMMRSKPRPQALPEVMHHKH
ncbi:Kinesin, motor domain-containing protein [Artemisia annua]|uniref:Kinesin, motor domain-containing protein n=1 Tax=Artemisia annua TaxID=35608 RepID=A0A2U1N935_ARTAN|nr:Kinesin, motor domain-containing protein [Artemisia annua]